MVLLVEILDIAGLLLLAEYPIAGMPGSTPW